MTPREAIIFYDKAIDKASEDAAGKFMSDIRATAAFALYSQGVKHGALQMQERLRRAEAVIDEVRKATFAVGGTAVSKQIREYDESKKNEA